jgi:uncharacterized protein YukE
MPPTQQQITVSIEALRADADQWAAAAATMNTAASRAGTPKIDADAFSFAGQAAAVTYGQLHDKLTQLMLQGASTFDAIAAALRASADSYEADEAAGEHRLRNIY